LAKDRPREAGDLFARGAVEQWYRSNGWDYPVPEAASTGVAQVQQYFEALGFSKPVKVSLEDNLLMLRGPAGGEAIGELRLITDEKRPIWVVLHSDAAWLDVREIELRPKVAIVRLGCRNAPGNDGDQHTSQVIITTNGRVKHKVTVRLSVQGKVTPPVPPVLPPLPMPVSSTATAQGVSTAPPPLPMPSPMAVTDAMPLRTMPPPLPPGTPPRVRTGHSWAALIPVVIVGLGIVSVSARDLLIWADPA
jgi:hypothetical protein